jgi:hypothetical protein
LNTEWTEEALALMLKKRALHFQRIVALQKNARQNPDAAKEASEPSSDPNYSLSEGVRPRRVTDDVFLARFNKIQGDVLKGKTRWQHGEI